MYLLEGCVLYFVSVDSRHHLWCLVPIERGAVEAE